MSDYSFPTLGEVVKYLFDITGVLSQEPEAKKAVQAQLRRLANEESELEENLNRLFDLLEECLSKVFGNEKVLTAFMFSFKYLFSHYEESVKGQGACLPRKDLFRWLIRNHLLSRIVFAYQKYFYMFNIPGSGLAFPEDQFWWLPDINGNDVRWPMTKAFQWIYEVAGLNQTHFHYPEYNDLSKNKNYRLAQNLENASRWANWKTEPRWDLVQNNLDDSLRALEECPLEPFQRTFDRNTKLSFRIVLFLARVATLIFREIDKSLGREYLESVITDFKKQDRRLRKKTQPLVKSTSLLVGFTSDSSAKDADRIWYEESYEYWLRDSQWAERAIPKAIRWVNSQKSAHWDLAIYKFLVGNLGSFDARDIVQQYKIRVHTWYKPNFMELLFKGLKLKRFGNTTKKQADDFVEELQDAGLDRSLGWLANWVQGAYYYRQERFDLAYPFYEAAFSQAKYSAGEHQYKLVNQYIEICAKNDRRREFKKGVAWANYLGIEVRWLRNTDGTEEDYEATYDILKKTNYPIL